MKVTSSMTLLFLLHSPPITLHPPFVCEQNELRFECPYFIQGLLLFFPSPIPSLSVTGRALSDKTGSFSLVTKIELHAS